MTYFTIRVRHWTGRRRAQTLDRQIGEIRGDGEIEVEIFPLLSGLLSGWRVYVALAPKVPVTTAKVLIQDVPEYLKGLAMVQP